MENVTISFGLSYPLEFVDPENAFRMSSGRRRAGWRRNRLTMNGRLMRRRAFSPLNVLLVLMLVRTQFPLLLLLLLTLRTLLFPFWLRPLPC